MTRPSRTKGSRGWRETGVRRGCRCLGFAPKLSRSFGDKDQAHAAQDWPVTGLKMAPAFQSLSPRLQGREIGESKFYGRCGLELLVWFSDACIISGIVRKSCLPCTQHSASAGLSISACCPQLTRPSLSGSGFWALASWEVVSSPTC